MIKGIHTSAAAMRIGMARQDLNANNLANADTAGFKRDRLFVHELVAARMSSNDHDLSAVEAASRTDLSAGALNPTSDPLHCALQGKDMFVVSNGQQELYTRSGRFQRNSDGILLDADGRKVQGEGGDISLPNGTVTISPTGEISVNAVLIDRLRVVQVEDSATLRKAGASSFVTAPGGAPPAPSANPTVMQGFLESSNVDSVREMVEMISTARNYEMNAKLLTAQDDSLRHSVGELGRV
ncbi:flagellar basal-body rod protein FlgF [candidate division KSB1 bacterium]|nr:flagellar basal-body rod protein FlgF [candidate division KSB1 bacterium]